MQDRKIKGIIFDMDGVLIDSEPVMFKAGVEAFKKFDIHAKADDFLPYIGMDEKRFFGNVSMKYGTPYREEMKDLAYSIYSDIIAQEIDNTDKTHEIIKTLKDRGYKISIASGAVDLKVNANIEALKIPRDTFDYIITGSNVQKNKPDPEIFIKAADGMGVKYDNCIVVEDSVSGVKAAKAGGMICVGITSSLDEDTLFSVGADYVYKDISFLLKILK